MDWLTSFDTDNAIKALCINSGVYDENKVGLLGKFYSNLIDKRIVLKKNKSKLSSNERKAYINKCKVEIKKNTISDYLLFIFKSNRTIKNKINSFITILYFIFYGVLT